MENVAYARQIVSLIRQTISLNERRKIERKLTNKVKNYRAVMNQVIGVGSYTLWKERTFK